MAAGADVGEGIGISVPVEIRVGYPHQKLADRTFVIRLDARPLERLIHEAGLGRRVYELMSIERPGDILHYLWVTVVDRSSELAKEIAKRHPNKFPRNAAMGADCDIALAFTEFEAGFVDWGEDTDDDTTLWLSFKETPEWRQHPARLLPLVKSAQEKLKNSTDYLVQHEIALMQSRVHRQDFSSTVQRYCDLGSEHAATEVVSTEVFDCIVRLAQQPDVRSVSCPFEDFNLWRALIAEQVRRSVAQGVAPNIAMRLNGSDSGIPFVIEWGRRADRDWGGEVHIPYEGVAGGDLFIQPKWFGFMAEAARTAPTLSQAVFGINAIDGYKTCKYLLTHWKSLGELSCATRTTVGDWFLYEGRDTQR